MYQHLPIKNLPYMNISWKRNTTAHHPAVLQKSDRSPPPSTAPCCADILLRLMGAPGWARHTPTWCAVVVVGSFYTFPFEWDSNEQIDRSQNWQLVNTAVLPPARL